MTLDGPLQSEFSPSRDRRRVAAASAGRPAARYDVRRKEDAPTVVMIGLDPAGQASLDVIDALHARGPAWMAESSPATTVQADCRGADARRLRRLSPLTAPFHRNFRHQEIDGESRRRRRCGNAARAGRRLAPGARLVNRNSPPFSVFSTLRQYDVAPIGSNSHG